MADAAQPILADEDGRDAYVTYSVRQAPRDGQKKALMLVSILAVSAVIVAVAAISVALSAHSTTTNTETQLKSQVSGISSVAMQNTKSEISGLMLMNQPVCVQSHVGYTACLELLNTARGLIADLENPSIPRERIVAKVKDGEYNIGNAVAFTTTSDDSIEIMPHTLGAAMNDNSIRLTASDVADLSKCDYVWGNVACLVMAEIGRSGNCDTDGATAENSAEQCSIKVVPIIHIFDSDNVIHEDGRARRHAEVKWVHSVAGGVPDRRPLDGSRRRGIGGPCFSGLGERLMCHCTSVGCGYLEYTRDPSCRWGC